MNEKSEGRLARAASPYLRSAVHQEVDWYEWGEEAFARARAEDKPILLDIGAVWCHWCHVIDRESYEDPRPAAIHRRPFVPVKVDRDERPDVDARYQATTSAARFFRRRQVKPLTGFSPAPNGRPFSAALISQEDAMERARFPPYSRSRRRGFRGRARRESGRRQRRVLPKRCRNRKRFLVGAENSIRAWRTTRPSLSCIYLIRATEDLAARRNSRIPRRLIYCSSATRRAAACRCWKSPRSRLRKWAREALYDQLAGGFHRYSVDERWCVPHFEKMSYDNSELLKNFLHGFQVAREPLFREIAEGIIDWTNAVLSDQSRGGFYASQDADQTLDDDGDYFTWTQDEVRAVLTAEEARVVELRYDVEAHGEMHHNPAKNVLWIARSIADVAKTIGGGVDMAAVLDTLVRAKAKLLAARAARPAPFVDTTFYVAWNAMYVSAYLDAAAVLGGEKGEACRAFALKTLDRMLAEAWSDARGFAHRMGGARLDGSLDDQIFAGIALLDAYEATLDKKYFEASRRATDFTIAEYFDAEGGGFFDRASGAPPMGGLELRRKPLQDSPTPGANSSAAILLDRLHGYSGDARYRACAEATLEAFAGIAPQFGIHAASYGLAVLLHARRPFEVVITGASDDPQAAALESAANSVYRFGKAVLRVTPERMAAPDALAPALAETLPHLRADVAQALVCVGTTCRPPVTDPAALVALLTQKPIVISAD